MRSASEMAMVLWEKLNCLRCYPSPFSSLREMDFFYSCKAPETRCATLITFSNIQLPLMPVTLYLACTKACFCILKTYKYSLLGRNKGNDSQTSVSNM